MAKAVKKALTKQEVKKRVDIGKYCALISVAVALVAVILGALLKVDFLKNVVGPLAILPMVYGVYQWISKSALLKKLGDLTCEKCDTRLTMADVVKYDKVSVDEQISHQGNTEYRTEYTTVNIHCKCRKCGQEKTIKAKLVTSKSGGLTAFANKPFDTILENYMSGNSVQ